MNKRHLLAAISFIHSFIHSFILYLPYIQDMAYYPESVWTIVTKHESRKRTKQNTDKKKILELSKSSMYNFIYLLRFYGCGLCMKSHSTQNNNSFDNAVIYRIPLKKAATKCKLSVTVSTTTTTTTIFI